MDFGALNREGVSSLEVADEAPAGCRHIGRARPYLFRRDHSDPLCLLCAVLYRPVLSHAIYIALLVRTILKVINQGGVLVAGAVTLLVALKILLTYAVCFSVSTFTTLSANRVRQSVK